MSAKILSSLSDDNRDFRKQIGCINIYKFFYRNNFPAAWRGAQQHKTLPAPVLCEQDMVDTHDARRKAVMQNQGEKARARARARASTGSSRTSYSSDHPETPSSQRKNSNSESQSQKATMSITKGLQSPDIRDVVKDSMHREARSLPIKFRTTDDSKVTLMKYVDSPRPLQQFKLRNPEANFHEERIKMSKHRSSFDERESRETIKLRELPRLSLDSRASALRRSLLDQRMDMESAGNHARSSSIIVKLMGLEAFPGTIPTPQNQITTATMTTQERTQHQASVFQPVSQKNHTSSSSSSSSSSRLQQGGPTTYSRVPMKSVPWKQRDCGQGCSPRVAAQSRKVLANGPHPSYSVYGEIEKRVTELEFRRSGKDLRALKQILESTQKTNGGVEKLSPKSSEFISHRRNSLDKNSELSILQNKTAYQQVPALKGTRAHKPFSSFGENKFDTKEKVKNSCSTKVPTMETAVQRETIQELKYKSRNPAFRERPKDVVPSWHLSSRDKKATWRNLEVERILRVPELKLENCTTSARGTEMASPRLQTNVLKIRGGFSPNTPSLDTGRAKKHSNKKVGEESSRSRRSGFKSSDLQLSDDQLSELSNETRSSSYQSDTASLKSEGNKSIASQMEREVITCLANSINTNPREQDSVTTLEESLQSLERETNVLEQPSPVSVLDSSFYNEDSPSPVAKISTSFREDERPFSEEQWHHESLRHLKEFKGSLPKYVYNPKSENLLLLVCERSLLGTEPSENAASTNGSVYTSLNQQQRCIREAPQESGDLKDTITNPKSDHLLSSWHPTNSKLFNDDEEKEDKMQAEKAVLAEKIHKKYFNQNIQRKVVLEMANYILSRKITRGGLFTRGKKKKSVHGLMEKICSEVDQLCSMPYCSLDDDDGGGLNRLLTADMKYESDDWTDHDSEVPYLVLDIERRIFKDLIKEVVTGEVMMGLHDCPKRTCRKLF